MEEEIKYRIVEINGYFKIQIHFYKEVGFLWWKKKIWSWYSTDINGYTFNPMFGYPSRNFKTLDEAIEQINLWKKDIVYHYIY